MRDLVIATVLLGLFPACFKRPFVGLCVFSWLAYMRVQDLSWGAVKDQRWSYYVAILMLAGYFRQPNRKPFFRADPRCFVMIGLALWVGVGVLLSEEGGARPGIQVRYYLEYVKIIAVALFTTGMVRNREELRIMLWVIALSLGFYGIKTGIGGILTFGAPVISGPGGLMKDNNDFALAMAMAVPMLFQLGWVERRPELRKAFWFAVPMTAFTVILTRSRGGFLSITAAVGVLVWRSRNRLMGIAVGVLILLSALALAPSDYKERLKTITAPTEEGSASSRLHAWGVATRMALDNPVFGVGLQKFRLHFREYDDSQSVHGVVGRRIVAHSSYFQIWAECGTGALLMYFGLILSSFWTCWKVRRMARARYFSSWIINYATMFEASLSAFIVGSAFLNRAHFDLFYHWVALIIAFGFIAREEMKNEELRPSRTATTGVRRGDVARVRKTGFRPVGESRAPVHGFTN